MKLEDFVKFHNDLLQFDISLPIAVSWNSQNGLIYRQLGKVHAFPYLSNYYFPNPKFSLGVLIPNETIKLLGALELLIQDPELINGNLNSQITNYGFKIYKLYLGVDGPQLTYDLKFVTFTNKLISSFVLYKSGLNSKILLKSLNNERRANKG